MNWFLALNESSRAFDLYCDLAKVAIQSALASTTLRPHFIYDGHENAFVDWLVAKGVRIFRHETFIRPELEALAGSRADPLISAIGRGAFLRVELPEIAARHGISGRVLYTDCDVMFEKDVVADLEAAPCRCFAVAPEFDTLDFERMNTGVMLMDLTELGKTLPAFRQFIRKEIELLPAEAWDQGAYRRYYRDEGKPLWDTLPVELNWKPYWGDNAAAKIIHFHGPKPFHRGYFDSHFPELKHLATNSYYEWAERWDEWLKRIDQ